MKVVRLFTAAAILAATSSAFAATAPDLNTDEAKISYAMGLNMGDNLRTHDVTTIDPAVFERGLADGIHGNPPAMTPAQLQDAFKKFQEILKAKQAAELQKASERNLAAGDVFMKAFQKQKDVKTTADGIAYKVITAGKGPTPKADDTVQVTYVGKLVNGVTFDSSNKTGKPGDDKAVDFPIKQLVPGLQKILVMMPVGSKWEIVLPPKEAYGDKGIGFGPIGPNETLDFTISVVGISPKK